MKTLEVVFAIVLTFSVLFFMLYSYGLSHSEDLAKTDDFLPFMIKTYAALADSFEQPANTYGQSFNAA